MLKNKGLVIGWAAALVAVLIVIGIIIAVNILGKQEVSMDEPVDVVADFYQPWLEAVQSTSTNPYQAGLAKWPFLGKELRAKISDARDVEGVLDPVLCQTVIPSDISMRIVSETSRKSEILVTARQSPSTEQALVTVLPLNGGWYISDIRCAPGEFSPEREFSFDKEGKLQKNVSAPLNLEYWHLVFEDNGTSGKYVPLFFGPESVCNGGVCSPDTFVEMSDARVQGEMTELGVSVKRLEVTQ